MVCKFIHIIFNYSVFEDYLLTTFNQSIDVDSKWYIHYYVVPTSRD
jgi:hypothetical protein